ncbi:hypothetical protein SDC9_94087 [bioreactor metagenome]|uniref:Uncharacterized protein n=1 Tax=bioreactor metagenome TaxID=1076179 RepID=A0A645A3T9_9ZZZZ
MAVLFRQKPGHPGLPIDIEHPRVKRGAFLQHAYADAVGLQRLVPAGGVAPKLLETLAPKTEQIGGLHPRQGGRAVGNQRRFKPWLHKLPPVSAGAVRSVSMRAACGRLPRQWNKSHDVYSLPFFLPDIRKNGFAGHEKPSRRTRVCKRELGKTNLVLCEMPPQAAAKYWLA